MNHEPRWGGSIVVLAVATTIAAATGADAQSAACVPAETALVFDGGYEVSMCWRDYEGNVGSARSGIWASGRAGLLWFFDRGNPEALVKLLNGCSFNNHLWVYVAPVTDVGFELWITTPGGRRWTHSNELGQPASLKIDHTAFRCSQETEPGGSDLVVDLPSVSVTNLRPGENFTLSATVRNRGNVGAEPTTLRWHQSPDREIGASDSLVGSSEVGVLDVSERSTESIILTAPASAGTYYYGACVDPPIEEVYTHNNCSSGVAVTVSASP